MQLISYDEGGSDRLGALIEGEVIDIASVDSRAPRTLVEALASGSLDLLARIASSPPAAARLPLAGLRIGLPIPRPGKIICLGLNYHDHVKEGPFSEQGFPALFMRSADSLVPSESAILRPRVSEQLDWEAELAVVIGRRAKHLTVENALTAVAGYSCFNDGSVRDYQRHTIQWTAGKNFDRTGGFGPVFVTADELPPGASGLKIESRLNGAVMQSSNTANMIFPVAETLAYITAGITLEPGDLVVMGTPAGVGHARNPPVWMKAGDIIEVEIEGIGVLRNPIADED